MYWDGEKSTYLPAPTAAAPDSQTTASAGATGQEVATGDQKKDDELKKQPSTPEKKVKVAKKIVKACKLLYFVCLTSCTVY